MFDKVYNMIKEKDILVPRLLFFKYKELNISDQELIVLIYLLNCSNTMYNPKEISNNLKIELVDVLTLVNDMSEKGIIKLDMVKNSGKNIEIVNLDELYNKLTFLVVNEKKETSIDKSIYALFENEFGRTLSPFELDLINAWKDNKYSDELIGLALKEAIYNGVTSLKYVDKVLEEWRKKNIRNKDDVEKNRKQFLERKNHKVDKKEVFSYDWLDDEE